jgi:hypothetical protein
VNPHERKKVDIAAQWDSVPLDELGRHGRMKPVKRALAGWGEIIELRNKAKDMFGDAIRLVHFRPLNHNNNRFTLLEINEREGKIRHYSSIADKAVIEGTAPTRVGRLVQVRYSFGDRDGDTADAISQEEFVLDYVFLEEVW